MNYLCKAGKLQIVAFHTNDELYIKEARRMKASAARLGLDVSIQQFESKGDWVKNTAIKAQFLSDIRRKFSGTILYVDVDAVFHNDPTEHLQALDCDIAVHFDCQNGHLMSGTILLNDTPNTQRLLEQWVEYCLEYPDVWDQQALSIVLENNPEIKYEKLPVVFCWVFDRVYNFNLRGDQPIYIEHLQASRSAKGPKTFLGSIFNKRKGLRRREKRIREIEKGLGL